MPAGGHSGVPRRVDVIPTPVGHDRPAPLEHDDERSRRPRPSMRGELDAVRLHLGHVLAGEPGEFTRMWSEDDGALQMRRGGPSDRPGR